MVNKNEGIMKSNLQDLIQYTLGLGVIDTIKITGTDTETLMNAVAVDKSVIASGKMKTAMPEFKGVFGMPNLSKLRTILGFDDYDETANISVLRVNKEGEDVPSAIHFETTSGDFTNDYRLMSRLIVEDKVITVTFKGASWNVEFEPSIQSIMRLKKQASANAEEDSFTIKTEKNELKVYFGNPSTHSGNFVFASGINGSLSRTWKYPVKVFLSIMDLPGDKKVKISDQGAVEITVDSGIADYTYQLPGQIK
jgi:hypothetical protein